MSMTIREPLDGDEEVISTLLGELGYPTAPEAVPGRLTAMDAEGGQTTFIAESEGEVIGMATVIVRHTISRDEPFGRLASVVVKDGERSRGVGAALLARAEEICRAAGCSAIEVTSAENRERAHEFYRRLGFEERRYRFVKLL